MPTPDQMRRRFLIQIHTMLRRKLGAPRQLQRNNAQHSLDGAGLGVVGNIRQLEVRVHLFTYNAVGARWRRLVLAPQAPRYRAGPRDTVHYLEFAWNLSDAAEFASSLPRVEACVDYFLRHQHDIST